MKKFVSIVAAAMMVMALPGVATAAQFNSPSGTTVTSPSSDVSLAVSGDVTSASGNGYLDVQPAASGVVADNVPAGVTPLATFEINPEGDITFTKLTLTFSVGTRYAGAEATVYVTHSDGSDEAFPVTVTADGTVSVTVDRLSVFSIVVDESTIPAGNATTPAGETTTAEGTGTEGVAGTTQSGTDTSATSPATGINTSAVAGISTVAALGAGAVAVALRKKVTE